MAVASADRLLADSTQTTHASPGYSRPVILVALDGSEKDGRAIVAAAAVSALSEGDLRFVRVIGQDVAVADGPDGDAALAHLAASLPSRARIVGTTRGREVNDIAGALIDYAAASADVLLVVLATRAANAGSRMRAGSVADVVMRESSRPVILVPPGAMPAETDATIARVLVPLDDSSLSFRSLEFIIKLPRAQDLDYVLVEVVGDEETRHTSEVRLAKTATWLRSRGPRKVQVLVLHSADPGGAIVSAAREARVDAILMSTRGAGGLDRLMLGSVAEAVVRQSELPVMLLTPRVLAPGEPTMPSR